jgi:hypothetical protein
MSNGVTNGKGLEWAVVKEIQATTGFQIEDSAPMLTAREAYSVLSGTTLAKIYARWVPRCVEHVFRLEPWVVEGRKGAGKIWINSDAKGQAGDVRDVLVAVGGKSLGVSCKNNHAAFKHSRLSPTIDFPSDWGLCQEGASDAYLSEVEVLFRKIEKAYGPFRVSEWSEVPQEKKFGYYRELLVSFREELLRIRDRSKTEAAELSSGLVKYVIGRHDFYKLIIREDCGLVEGYNLSRKLSIPGIPLPSTILGVEFVPGAAGTLLVFMDAGYTFSFRIHSASSKIESSLKFDIQAIGLPRELYRHHFVV